ncbi:hypothetical protein SAMN04488515_2920 [Cognatiyoonia koreensis]|uniref:Uncharacterized protein n=1 Tax=Cognatiyoonia koreensis TaxID=364200 RepID=A0A1I0RMC7_9RHOB|nr:hypothetical protein [Cognatiyoonia koreensis]SEW42100.1 hypothetical protein SAMN04488515_2920 [Cognatiyoonia koreensis]
MTIRIDGPAPGLGLNLTDYSGQMNATGQCLTWCTVDSPDLEVVDESIVEIRPRAGNLALRAPEFSMGPQLSETAGFPAAFHERDVLDYLGVDTNLDGSCFSLAAVCDLEALINSPQTLFAICSKQKSVRLLRQADRYIVKHNGQDILEGPAEWDAAGVFLAILSASDGKVRFRVRDLTKTGEIGEVAFENPHEQPCSVVFAADQIAEKPDAPTPSAPRSWRGHFLEMLAFDTDILSEGDALELLDRYFTEIYVESPSRV